MRRVAGRVLPYPLMAAALLIGWALLSGSLSPGSLLLGAAMAVGACWFLALLEPRKPRLRRPALALRLLGLVAADVVRSNIAVARIILGPGRQDRNSGFVSIPLELRDPNGLAVLACILTAAPGTAWVDYDPARGVLLMHVLDLVDEATWVDTVKNRYEVHLMEIFR
jgi:multicomponent K+:H+ antiporter subunit E